MVNIDSNHCEGYGTRQIRTFRSFRSITLIQNLDYVEDRTLYLGTIEARKLEDALKVIGSMFDCHLKALK